VYHLHNNSREGIAMKGFFIVLRCSLAVALIASPGVWMTGCSKSDEQKQEAKVEQKGEAKATATMENLKLAYTSELKHAAWYEAYARQAQKEGLAEVAAMFRALSQSEKLHADNMGSLLKARGVEPAAATIQDPPAGKTRQYLKAASSNEGVEAESMYPPFVKAANDEKDSAAAELFTETLGADQRHGRLLKKAIESEVSISALPYMMCPKCGYIKGSDRDTECRVCKTKIDAFKKL
jgi:rubrerythrin